MAAIGRKILARRAAIDISSRQTLRESRDALLQRAAEEPDLTWRVLSTLNTFRALIAFALLTLFMLHQASQLRIDAGFAKLLPLKHEYMTTYLKYREEFGGANRVVIAIRAREGDIFTPEFFEVLAEITDEVFFIPGVDRLVSELAHYHRPADLELALELVADPSRVVLAGGTVLNADRIVVMDGGAIVEVGRQVSEVAFHQIGIPRRGAPHS